MSGSPWTRALSGFRVGVEFSSARSPAAYGTAEDDADLGRYRREEELGALWHQGTQCAKKQDAGSTARSPAAQGTTEDDVDLGCRHRRREEDIGALSVPWHRTPTVDSDKPDPAHGGGDGNGGATATPRSVRDHMPRTALPPSTRHRIRLVCGGEGMGAPSAPAQLPRPHGTSLPPERRPRCHSRPHAASRVAPAWNHPSSRTPPPSTVRPHALLVCGTARAPARRRPPARAPGLR
jgi:hypothetical protein